VSTVAEFDELRTAADQPLAGLTELDHLDWLESEAIHVLRALAGHFAQHVDRFR